MLDELKEAYEREEASARIRKANHDLLQERLVKVSSLHSEANRLLRRIADNNDDLGRALVALSGAKNG